MTVIHLPDVVILNDGSHRILTERVRSLLQSQAFLAGKPINSLADIPNVVWMHPIVMDKITRCGYSVVPQKKTRFRWQTLTRHQ